MKILVSWLRDFVPVTASPEDIARTMSVRGFAVEGIEYVGTDLSAGADREAVRPASTGSSGRIATRLGEGGRTRPTPRLALHGIIGIWDLGFEYPANVRGHCR